ncbi:hypothetical protein [Litoreibacter janthinus]|uniref:Uncharacterized protein n=1 Tax=Litoreibacter janthinus TaxID=670154 RepID=A0A1I6HN72_9RHOB|nr:hypothetical protein [Litoreibacter janthinus]SFR55787.1 hypothetical protein SAMN04488002_3181 [Litoreibacter janthinus]
MPKLITFLLRHALGGAVAGVAFSALLIWSNVAGLRHLVLETADGPLAAGIMTVFFIITFASVQMGRAIMAMAEPEDHDDLTPPRGGVLIPIKVSERG